jgi:site-specific DNA-adenine methylase
LKYKIDKNNPNEYAELRTTFNQNKDNPYMFFSCCCSCTNNLMRFNKKKEFNQTFGKRAINDSTLEKLKDYHDRIFGKNVVFTNKPFYEVWNLMKKYEHINLFFFYLDPPYIQTDAGYNVYWSKEDEEKLYNMMDEMDLMGVSFAMSNTLKHKGELNPSCYITI